MSTEFPRSREKQSVFTSTDETCRNLYRRQVTAHSQSQRRPRDLQPENSRRSGATQRHSLPDNYTAAPPLRLRLLLLRMVAAVATVAASSHTGRVLNIVRPIGPTLRTPRGPHHVYNANCNSISV